MSDTFSITDWPKIDGKYHHLAYVFRDGKCIARYIDGEPDD